MSFTSIFTKISELPGIGPKRYKLMVQKGLDTIHDLLFYYPKGFDDRREQVTVKQALEEIGQGSERSRVITVARIISQEYFGFRRSRTLKVMLDDGTGLLVLLCFNRNFLAKQLKVGKTVLIIAHCKYQFNELQSSQFEFHLVKHKTDALPGWDELLSSGQYPNIGTLLPVYGLTNGLSQQTMRNSFQAVRDSIHQYNELKTDLVPPKLRSRRALLGMQEAFLEVHQAQSEDRLIQAQYSLAYEELFLYQLEMIYQKMKQRSESQTILSRTLYRRVEKGLPFELTESQKNEVERIIAQMESTSSIHRLLQGDVGSGKTVTAVLAALPIIEEGNQVLLLCPTEILARQHYSTVSSLLEKEGIICQLLLGSFDQKSRSSLEKEISLGTVQFIVGTHASISDRLKYANLKFIIFDEQHRFGVDQRKKALSKGMARGTRVHSLSMSATPIPRSLALGLFGNTDMGEIKEKPSGRKEIKTHLALMNRDQMVYDFIRKELEKGHQAYFVYPRIDDLSQEAPDSPQMKSVEQMYKMLDREIFPDYRVGLLHSKLTEEQKFQIMEEFQSGSCHVLVATTMVEVGVDNPNANCIVVEHAERFGLASLHQLRGRVGRSDIQSYCFLVYDENLSDIAKERLRTLLQSNDGFYLAEKDLELRGPGDLSGFQQSGFVGFKAAQFPKDMPLLAETRSDAEELLKEDPLLEQEENQNLKSFLENNISSIWEKQA